MNIVDLVVVHVVREVRVPIMLLVHKLLQQWNHVVLVVAAWDHVRAQQRHNLRIRHLLVVEWINLVQEWLDLALVLEHAHRHHQVAEFLLVQGAVVVEVEPLEVQIKFLEETLMLLKLEVKNHFLEISKQVFRQVLVTLGDLLLHLTSGHFALLTLSLLNVCLGTVLNHFTNLALESV